MLDKCKKHAFTTRGKLTVSICASVIFIVAMVFGMLVLAAPYAVYAGGEKINDPWVVKVDGKEVAIVESEVAGESVMTGVRAVYYDDIATQIEAKLTGAVTIEKYDFKDNSVHPVVMSTPEAVDYIVNQNKTGDVLVGLETTDIVEEKEKIAFETKVVEDSSLEKGTTKVVTEGKAGSKFVISRVIEINGEEAEKNIISETVTVAPVTKVVHKGTKEKVVERPTATTSNANSGSRSGLSSSDYRGPSYNVPASRNGAAVAGYAKQFVGLPYVYGGSSLTSGADCSGFTMAVYAKFGVSLPRTSYAQGGAGVQVPASQAAPGDLVCYGGHVGIYLGGGRMVHSSTPGTGVIISSVNYAPHTFVRVI